MGHDVKDWGLDHQGGNTGQTEVEGGAFLIGSQAAYSCPSLLWKTQTMGMQSKGTHFRWRAGTRPQSMSHNSRAFTHTEMIWTLEFA